LVLLTIENQPKAGMIKARNALFSLFLETFTVRDVITSFSDPDTFKDDELLSLEESIIEAVITMTIKLNDTTFRPFFVQLVDVVGSIAKDDVGNVISITFCRFLAAFFDRFKSIVTSYSSYVIEHAERLLKYLAGRDDEGVSELREATLSALQKSFQYDQDGFWQSPSHYNNIMPVLLQQLTVAVPLATTETAIIPAITELATASSASVDNHRAMNAIMFKYMRAEEAHIRLATVKCEQGLTKRLGEEWLSMLPEMLPFISELREDDDEIVERETQKWINMMEEMTGEDLEGMLQ
jgi:U3 small nucleolar RNA-associated protein 10